MLVILVMEATRSSRITHLEIWRLEFQSWAYRHLPKLISVSYLASVDVSLYNYKIDPTVPAFLILLGFLLGIR